MLTVEPDETNQFRIEFEPLDPIDGKLMDAVFKRHDEALIELARPYSYPTEEQKAQRSKQQPKGGRGGAAGGRGGARQSGGAAKGGRGGTGGRAGANAPRGRKY